VDFEMKSAAIGNAAVQTNLHFQKESFYLLAF
jgi:hypothetical protein